MLLDLIIQPFCSILQLYDDPFLSAASRLFIILPRNLPWICFHLLMNILLAISQ